MDTLGEGAALKVFVGILSADLADEQQGAHSAACAPVHRVGQPEALQVITLSSLPHPDLVDQLDAFCVVAIGPFVACPGLTQTKVVWSEDASKPKRTGSIVLGSRITKTGRETD